MTQPKPPSLFHFSAIIALFTITLCFTNWMSGTGYLGNNHNHYTFFKCDWCMSCFNFLLLILYSCNWTVGCNRTPVIGQLKQRIIQVHSAKSTNHGVNHNNHSNNHLSKKEFPKWRHIFYFRHCLYQRYLT